jgi:iron complex outermembrane receptor protein
VPRDANYGVMARYAFADTRLKGFSVGASWKKSGSFAGDAANTFFLPGDEVTDAFVAYDRKNWGVQLNFYNLTNTDAIVSTVSDQQVAREMAFHTRLTLRFKF